MMRAIQASEASEQVGHLEISNWVWQWVKFLAPNDQRSMGWNVNELLPVGWMVNVTAWSKTVVGYTLYNATPWSLYVLKCLLVNGGIL